jgi:murein DD-endopeptidase MepM/ murein hydrolase activator NlpD
MIFRLETMYALRKLGWISCMVLIILLLGRAGSVIAQETQPAGQIYIVQAGDTLSSIALRFGVTVEDLVRVNNITDPNALAIGAQLIIPGPEMVQGTVVTLSVPYGETLRSLGRRYQLSEDILVQLNRLVSPAELYTGATLVVPKDKTEVAAGGRAYLADGQSLLELAVIQGVSPWALVSTNAISGTWDVLPGDVLRLPAGTNDGPGAMPQGVQSVEVKPFPAVQGKTVVVHVTTSGEMELGGSLMGYPLHFFSEQPGTYIALQGVHARVEPGLASLTITGTLPGGVVFDFTQGIVVEEGGYLWETVTGVPVETLDPAVTKPEDDQWYALASPATPVKFWNEIFKNPVPMYYDDCYPVKSTNPARCWVSFFGNRRSYNGSTFDYYHAGLDMIAVPGEEIHAAAPGVVVFTGLLTVRGNATMIDHGWGVYSAYLHQSEFKVNVGDRVEAGQVIGLVGQTGRVAGPHLHFEILVGGVPVNPLDWMEQVFP